MRSVKVITICHATHATVSLAHPQAKLGNGRNAVTQIRQISNVPADIPDAKVVAMWKDTIDITWLGGLPPRLEFDYIELGTGKVINN